VLPWFTQVDEKMVQGGCCVACGYLLMEKMDKRDTYYIISPSQDSHTLHNNRPAT